MSVQAQQMTPEEEAKLKREINEIKWKEDAVFAEIVDYLSDDSDKAVTQAQQQSMLKLQTVVVELFAQNLNMKKEDVQEIWDTIEDKCQNIEIRSGDVIRVFRYIPKALLTLRNSEVNLESNKNKKKQKELDEYLAMMEEAKKRDHRKLGKELGLFMFNDVIGKGLPLWLPKGTDLRLRLQNFLTKIQKRYGYEQVITPHIGGKQLYVTSGHWEHYGADSFRPITTPEEGEEYLLKPMNCPHHCMIFRNEPRSYKDLPIRYAEFGTVYRYEQSGELHGLTRVRSFTQDDAHIFCRPDQVKEEFIRVMEIIEIIFKALSFDKFEAQISLRDPNNKTKYVGTDENWAKAEAAIVEACKEKNLPAKVEYGEAAFYGPKLDFMVKDAIGRRWQLGTIQVDYNLPERFDLEYIGNDNQKHRPVMIHRAPFGSMERFVAVLIEHTGGKFPLWLTPEQFIILPVSEKFEEHARQMEKTLDDMGLRGIIDLRNEKIGRKIRDAEMKKIPFMLILGEKEVEEGTLSVRRHGQGDLGSMTPKAFAEMIETEIQTLL